MKTNQRIISNTCILETIYFATLQIVKCVYVGFGNVDFMCFIATIRIFMVFGLLAICLLLLNLVPDIFGCGGAGVVIFGSLQRGRLGNI